MVNNVDRRAKTGLAIGISSVYSYGKWVKRVMKRSRREWWWWWCWWMYNVGIVVYISVVWLF